MLLDHEPPPVRELIARDADALIREARRRTRRRRLRVAALLIAAGIGIGVLLADGGAGGSAGEHASAAGASGSAAAPRPASTPADAARHLTTLPNISDMGLFGPGDGWAANGLGFYITSDDGAHWRQVPVFGGDVVANLGPVTSVGAENLFVGGDGGKGYGTCGHPTRPSPNAGIFPVSVVFASNDGGASWRSSRLPGCAVAFGLSFVSAQTGFALADAGGFPGRGRVDLTTDGARTWRPLGGAPFVGPIDFASRLDGWGLASAGVALRPLSANGAVYRTTDGGRSWQRVPICSGAANHGVAVICGTPHFFSTRDGLIPAGVIDHRSGADSLVVFATSDGGAHWSSHTLPADPDLRDYFSASNPLSAINGTLRLAVPFSAPAASDWIAFVGPRLYTTSDGGRHWSTITPRPTFAAPRITGNGTAINASGPLVFASPSDGWVIADWSGASPVFDHTTNGGRTWSPLAKQ
jgi:photosystem II stability/assembly factor-like uncharacterized protein